MSLCVIIIAILTWHPLQRHGIVILILIYYIIIIKPHCTSHHQEIEHREASLPSPEPLALEELMPRLLSPPPLPGLLLLSRLARDALPLTDRLSFDTPPFHRVMGLCGYVVMWLCGYVVVMGLWGYGVMGLCGYGDRKWFG